MYKNDMVSVFSTLVALQMSTCSNIPSHAWSQDPPNVGKLTSQ